jgi:hypothetical protein
MGVPFGVHDRQGDGVGQRVDSGLRKPPSRGEAGCEPKTNHKS